MKESPVIGLSGVIASGKSTVALGFSEEMGWKYVSFGDFVRKTAKERGFDPNDRKILQEIGADLINDDLEGFCKAVLEQENWGTGEPLIIDGVRHVEVQLMLKKLVAPSSFILVYLYVNEEIRMRNLIDERRTELSQLKELEKDSTERQVKSFLPDVADYVLDGNKPYSAHINSASKSSRKECQKRAFSVPLVFTTYCRNQDDLHF